MKQRVNELVKLDMGLTPQSLNGNATGRYHHMRDHGSALFVLLAGAIAATKTAKLEVFEGKDVAGTGGQKITGAEALITANSGVDVATIALAAVANTDKVTVNGIEFTKAAATEVADKEFADAAGLVLCILYWCPGLTASAADTTVTVQAAEPGAKTVTLSKTEVAGTITLATVQAMAYVEVNTDALTKGSGYQTVAAKVTTDAAIVVGVQVLRGDGRLTPVQAVAASKVLPDFSAIPA